MPQLLNPLFEIVHLASLLAVFPSCKMSRTTRANLDACRNLLVSFRWRATQKYASLRLLMQAAFGQFVDQWQLVSVTPPSNGCPKTAYALSGGPLRRDPAEMRTEQRSYD
jgi:hypothetical protein